MLTLNSTVISDYVTPTKTNVPWKQRKTGGSVGGASGCHTRGREFDSGRTITKGLKITGEKVLPLQLHQQMVRLSSVLG